MSLNQELGMDLPDAYGAANDLMVKRFMYPVRVAAEAERWAQKGSYEALRRISIASSGPSTQVSILPSDASAKPLLIT